MLFSRTSAMAAVFAVVTTSVMSYAATVVHSAPAHAVAAPEQVVMLERVEISGKRQIH
jgi:hypothetical protein